MPASVIMVVTPVTLSPFKMDQVIGLDPRYAGSRDACTFTVPSFGMSRISWERICPKAAVTQRSGLRSERSFTPSSRIFVG